MLMQKVNSICLFLSLMGRVSKCFTKVYVLLKFKCAEVKVAIQKYVGWNFVKTTLKC